MVWGTGLRPRKRLLGCSTVQRAHEPRTAGARDRAPRRPAIPRGAAVAVAEIRATDGTVRFVGVGNISALLASPTASRAIRASALAWARTEDRTARALAARNPSSGRETYDRCAPELDKSFSSYGTCEYDRSRPVSDCVNSPKSNSCTSPSTTATRTSGMALAPRSDGLLRFVQPRSNLPLYPYRVRCMKLLGGAFDASLPQTATRPCQLCSPRHPKKHNDRRYAADYKHGYKPAEPRIPNEPPVCAEFGVKNAAGIESPIEK